MRQALNTTKEKNQARPVLGRVSGRVFSPSSLRTRTPTCPSESAMAQNSLLGAKQRRMNVVKALAWTAIMHHRAKKRATLSQDGYLSVKANASNESQAIQDGDPIMSALASIDHLSQLRQELSSLPSMRLESNDPVTRHEETAHDPPGDSSAAEPDIETDGSAMIPAEDMMPTSGPEFPAKPRLISPESPAAATNKDVDLVTLP